MQAPWLVWSTLNFTVQWGERLLVPYTHLSSKWIALVFVDGMYKASTVLRDFWKSRGKEAFLIKAHCHLVIFSVWMLNLYRVEVISTYVMSMIILQLVIGIAVYILQYWIVTRSISVLVVSRYQRRDVSRLILRLWLRLLRLMREDFSALDISEVVGFGGVDQVCGEGH